MLDIEIYYSQSVSAYPLRTHLGSGITTTTILPISNTISTITTRITTNIFTHFVPARDYLTHAKAEGERFTAVETGVELFS